MLPSPTHLLQGRCLLRQAQLCLRLVLEARRENLRATKMSQEGHCLSRWPVIPHQQPCCHSYCQLRHLTPHHASKSSWDAQALVRKEEALLTFVCVLYNFCCATFVPYGKNRHLQAVSCTPHFHYLSSVTAESSKCFGCDSCIIYYYLVVV